MLWNAHLSHRNLPEAVPHPLKSQLQDASSSHLNWVPASPASTLVLMYYPGRHWFYVKLFANYEVHYRWRKQHCYLFLTWFFTCSVFILSYPPLYTPLDINWDLIEVKKVLCESILACKTDKQRNNKQQQQPNQGSRELEWVSEWTEGCSVRVGSTDSGAALWRGHVVRVGKRARASMWKTSVQVWTVHWLPLWTPLIIHILMWKMRKVILLYTLWGGVYEG